MRKDRRHPSTKLSEQELGYLSIYVRRHILWLYKQLGYGKTRRRPIVGAMAKMGREVIGSLKKD